MAGSGRSTWGRLIDVASPYPTTGLRVRDPARSYTTKNVAEALAWAADVATKAEGGRIQIGDVSWSTPGATIPPHQTHRAGQEVDVGYTADRFPSVSGVPMDRTVARFLHLLYPYVPIVLVSAAQREEFFARRAELVPSAGGLFPTLVVHPGHDNWMHLIFEGARDPKSYAFDYDDDGGATAAQYMLPAAPDDFGWYGPAEGYAYARQTLRNYLDAPEGLQKGNDPSVPGPASRILGARAYDWFRYYRAPTWPTVALACTTTTDPACQFYSAAAWYMHAHASEN